MSSLTAPICYPYSPYSTDELDNIEKEFVALINQSNLVIRDPLVTVYINNIGHSLSRYAHLEHPPTFFIVKSNEINAFAGPGGYIGVNTQLILASRNENELAGVLAHEIAHVRLHHLYQLIQHEKNMKAPMIAAVLASAALGLLNPALGNGALMAAITGFSQDNVNFVRSNEKEADRIGIDMLKKAGFDPRGMASFFQKMQETTRLYYTANIPPILRSHPLDDERIAEAENRIGPQDIKNRLDSQAYAFFKEKIRVESSEDNAITLVNFYQKQCQHHSSLACAYGQGLAYLKDNAPKKALSTLSPLYTTAPNSPDIIIAIASAQIKLGQSEAAFSLYENYLKQNPENYPALMYYADALLENGAAQKSLALLLKARRHFPQSILVCERLARAQAQTNKKGYAYLTLAQCLNMQGYYREAYRQLKAAKTYEKNDRILKLRIDAMMDEVKDKKQ